MHNKGADCEFSIYFRVVMCPLLMIAAICSLAENVFFCIVVCVNKKLQIKSNILIVSLSITDIIIASTGPVFEFIYVLKKPKWPLGRAGSNIQNAMWLFSLVMPFATVTAITIERYLAITKSIQYNRYATSNKLLLTVGCLYLYSLVWVICIAMSFHEAHRYVYYWNVPECPYFAFLGVNLLLPLILIPVLYKMMLKKVRLSRQTADVDESERNEIKLVKTVGIIIAFLFLVWAPVLVLEIIYQTDFKNCIIEEVGTVSVFITCLNGAINPLVYSYRNDEVKKYILKVFCCCKRRHEEEDSRKGLLDDEESQVSSVGSSTTDTR